jgi:hypothetical protein
VKLAIAFAVVVSSVVPRGAGDGPRIVASASCDEASGPGRVRCEITVRAENGTARWGDVIVTSAPKFAPALRTRIAPGDAVDRGDGSRVFPLALAAVKNGVGTLVLRARAVVCGARGCVPVTTEASAEVVVGAPADGGAP